MLFQIITGRLEQRQPQRFDIAHFLVAGLNEIAREHTRLRIVGFSLAKNILCETNCPD